MDTLLNIQGKFKDDLLKKVETFKHDTDQFYTGYAEVCECSYINFNDLLIILYTQSGPTAPGITPREASDRLNLFQTQFDDLWRRYQTYTDGESLFGLTVTAYDELNRIRKELNLLQKLYGLYNTVIDSIDGYNDILWLEVSWPHPKVCSRPHSPTGCGLTGHSAERRGRGDPMVLGSHPLLGVA